MTQTQQIPSPIANFSTFIMGLASASLIEMGVLEDPLTHQKRVDRDAAHQHIELLKMLQEKTRGNLNTDEKELIEHVLTDLKIQFARI